MQSQHLPRVCRERTMGGHIPLSILAGLVLVLTTWSHIAAVNRLPLGDADYDESAATIFIDDGLPLIEITLDSISVFLQKTCSIGTVRTSTVASLWLTVYIVPSLLRMRTT